jgi:phytoene synthase
MAHEAWSSVAAVVPRPGVSGRTLHHAYAFCNTLTARYSRSFHLASSFLPAGKRRATRALYAFCRTADNIVDTPG